MWSLLMQSKKRAEKSPAISCPWQHRAFLEENAQSDIHLIIFSTAQLPRRKRLKKEHNITKFIRLMIRRGPWNIPSS